MPNASAGGCMHVQTAVPGLPDKVSDASFPKYLVERAGYTAGWFGKHLNGGACPKDPPPGFDCPTCRWFANNGGQDTEPGGYQSATFYDFNGPTPANGTYSRNGTYWSWLDGAPVVHGMKVPQFAGYTTSIIANKSIEWLERVGGAHAPRSPTVSGGGGALTTPFLLVLAPKAPHYAATPAEWYEHGTWVDHEKAPRTESYGVDPSRLSNHHALIARQGPLLSDERDAIDRQFRKRWKSLLSVDDAIVGLADTLDRLALWETTYFFVTSDHGYNLGQHNLPSCKYQAYDHGIRVPMMIRGPGVAQGTNFTQPASHVDLAPTLLALAGLDPTTIHGPLIDGKSLLPWLLAPPPRGDDDEEEEEDDEEEASVVAGSRRLQRLPPATRLQYELEVRRLGAADALSAAVSGGWVPPAVRDAVLVEYYSLGNLTVCGGGTCKGDRDDPYGYCHMPCFNLTCDLKVCTNVTCCGEANTIFSSLEGMRCGAGHAPGTLPYNTSDDPGHQCDATDSGSYRGLRFLSAKYGNKLYAEFTAQADWNFTSHDVFTEIFDLDADPGQLNNLANSTPAAEMTFYRDAMRGQFACAGPSCW